MGGVQHSLCYFTCRFGLGYMRYDEGILGKPEGLPAGRADRVEYSELGQKSSPKQRALDLARFDERLLKVVARNPSLWRKV